MCTHKQYILIVGECQEYARLREKMRLRLNTRLKRKGDLTGKTGGYELASK
jgi:hypothetical protein